MRYTEALSTHSSQAANKTLRNTYGLLSLTLLFSAFTAGMSMAFNLPHPGLIITLVGFYGLLFLTHKFKNSSAGLLCVFALTGFMGITLGPILSMYMNMPGGGSLIMSALGITGLSFLGLSAYALISKKDFSFLNGFITVGFFVLLFAVIAGIFIKMPALQIFISAGFALFSAAVILLQTSQIVRGGETNYIVATVTLYVSIYNMFLSVLSLLGMARD
ncbi:MAG: Bax inhibitor-1/YccA family protein [Gammaproteobacteria bacterium]|uniref:Bax inhibitor-1/YccA family protein n=1 Tax=unclassified Marinomonas TaxID=196814 RepID=UPI000C1EAD6D|nr:MULTISPECIES: Bax inhibitor-1/YccA family protein [unclassified Marinomonas]MBU1293931.1 Bax inhibitor-1/YccA family protein [Gammaproteobacteria bacterium]MBU1466310.1 Bax inhibitor-1/YccA family protein [Gammaproteobacteria bacterium]MBU2320624.1 Bax inhibitor-1/YccA family protein [Gammaproteobacteria bacterium]MBU2413028.1 Bax inhibitor-1/YccA family protein [Gammaproteobacteria bacterium]PJE55535.1 membrane protein [Marinomonas sp. BSi20584]